jgi:hypothetical protein
MGSSRMVRSRAMLRPAFVYQSRLRSMQYPFSMVSLHAKATGLHMKMLLLTAHVPAAATMASKQ